MSKEQIKALETDEEWKSFIKPLYKWFYDESPNNVLTRDLPLRLHPFFKQVYDRDMLTPQGYIVCYKNTQITIRRK